MKKRRLLTCALALLAVVCGGVGVATYTGVGTANEITAKAAELGVIELATRDADKSWLGDNNKRILFKLPSSVAVGNYDLQEGGTVSLIRGGSTYTRTSATIENVSGQNNNAYIVSWQFGSLLGETFVGQPGDKFVINGTFSNGTDSFTIENATIIVNSTTNGDMYVESSVA